MILGAILLTGGRSRRMGEAKEALPFGDNSLLGHAADQLLECCHPVVVVRRDPHQKLPPLAIEAELVDDPAPDQGPLAGLVAGLRALAGRCDAAFLTGCDHPHLDAGPIHALSQKLGDHCLVMPRAQERLQPLAAIYRCDLLPQIEALRAREVRTPRSLAELEGARVLEEAELRTFDPQLRLLRNLNTPEEYRQAVAELAPPS